MEMTIQPATTPDEMDQVRSLMRAYGAHLAANPGGAAHICIVGYEQEVATLPGPYRVLLLATRGGEAAGCVALKPVPATASELAGETVCEMKRLYVADSARGSGLGRRLIGAAIDWAREAGFAAMVLDTVPAAMPAANALYESFGFRRIARYNENPVADVVFYRLRIAECPDRRRG
jgi:GNAT superfamily N-acetyltransferase